MPHQDQPHTTETTLIANWDGIFGPRSASPRQLLAAIYAFAELYTYQWQGWITTMPPALQTLTRASLACIYVPHVICLYNNKLMTQTITQLKTGLLSEHEFFTYLLNTHFAFLKHIENLELAPIELIRNTWLHQRIQDLTPREVERFKRALTNFDRIILIANSNTPDIRAFITNSSRHPMLKMHFANAPEILKQLNDYTLPNKAVATLEQIKQRLLSLDKQCHILTSIQTGEFKVQTGKLAALTESSGFLDNIITAENSKAITVLSEAPADLQQARTHKDITVATGDQFFADTSNTQRWHMHIVDNAPVMVIFIIVIALLYFAVMHAF